MPKFLTKEQIAALSFRQLEKRLFVFESSPADEKYFRAALAKWLADKNAPKSDEFREFREFLWDITFERNDGGKTIKYLHFNERAQKCYLDWYFVEWAERASDEISEKLEKSKI